MDQSRVVAVRARHAIRYLSKLITVASQKEEVRITKCKRTEVQYRGLSVYTLQQNNEINGETCNEEPKQLGRARSMFVAHTTHDVADCYRGGCVVVGGWQLCGRARVADAEGSWAFVCDVEMGWR